MTTKHSFTHEDGNVSTRTSANRVYPYAIEYGPQTVEAKIAELEDQLGHVVKQYEKYTAVVTSQVVPAAYAASSTLEDYARYASKSAQSIARIEAQIADLRASGQTHVAESWSITSWHGSRELAEKAASSVRGQYWARGRVIRVVETVYETK